MPSTLPEMISQVQALHRQLAELVTSAPGGGMGGLAAGQRATAAAVLEAASETLVSEIDSCPEEARLPGFCPACSLAADRSYELHELAGRLRQQLAGVS
jgi:hypothetical protein